MCIGDCKCGKHMQRFDLLFQFSVSQVKGNRKKMKRLQPVNHAVPQITTYTWVLIGLKSSFYFCGVYVNRHVFARWIEVLLFVVHIPILSTYNVILNDLLKSKSLTFCSPFLFLQTPILNSLPPHVSVVLGTLFQDSGYLRDPSTHPAHDWWSDGCMTEL